MDPSPRSLPFELHQRNGQLRMISAFNSNNKYFQRLLNISIIAFIEIIGNRRDFVTLAVRLRLIPSNDHCPMFHGIPKGGLIRLERGQASFSRAVHRVNATDKDFEGNITYTLLGNDDTREYFTIDSKSGEVILFCAFLFKNISHLRFILSTHSPQRQGVGRRICLFLMAAGLYHTNLQLNWLFCILSSAKTVPKPKTLYFWRIVATSETYTVRYFYLAIPN